MGKAGEGRGPEKGRGVLHNQNEGSKGSQWGEGWEQGPWLNGTTGRAPRTRRLAPRRHCGHDWFSHPGEGRSLGQNYWLMASALLSRPCSSQWRTVPWPLNDATSGGPPNHKHLLGHPQRRLHSLLQVCLTHSISTPASSPHLPIWARAQHLI